MSRQTEALVEPRLLIWARKSAGFSLSEAARKSKVNEGALAKWEEGPKRPTIPQLRKLSKAYRRPIAVFYLPEPPTEFQALRDFRRLTNIETLNETPELIFEIRQAQSRREFAIELYEEVEGVSPTFRLSAMTTEDPEDVGRRIRDYLGISLEEQLQWRTEYQAFNCWREAMERAGILVFQMTDVAVTEARGFSIFAEKFPAVVVNIKDAVYGRVFTILHELAHLALREGGVCNLLEDQNVDDHSREIEVYCNHVAGAALVPRLELLRDKDVVTKTGEFIWSDEELHILANRYSCSREAVVRRLLICERTSLDFYHKKRRQFQNEFSVENKKRTKGYVPPDRLALSKAGHLFVRLVFNNYFQNNITASDVAEFLGTRLKHLNKMERAVTTTVG